MYDRRVADETLTFGHAGRLYENSFVFYDHQTNSQWVHVTGTAGAGPYKGTRLTFIPSTVTSWREWKKLHPNTKVLPGFGRGGFMGTYRGFYNDSDFGLVVTQFNQAKLYPFETLKERPVINDTFRDEPIVVSFNSAERTATAWGRNVNGRTLIFSHEYDAQEGFLLVDKQTHSKWDPTTGRSIGGSLKGAELPALTYNPILIDRFHAHYPEGVTFTD